MRDQNLEWYQIVGRNLRWLRARDKVSVAQVSQHTGVTRRMIERLEREEFVARFCVSHVKRLCDYFGVTAHQLLECDLGRQD